MTSSIERRVAELVQERIAERSDLFIVDIKMHANGKLIVRIDGDEGVNVQDCAQISRHVGFHLEEEDVIASAYNLEVSSAGVDAPLVSERQYQKNIGRSLQITQSNGQVVEGKLLEVGEQQIVIAQTVKERGKKATTSELAVPYNQIITTKVLISFK